MRVFVTGATGFVGSAVVRELLAAGHEVLGLARTERAAEALAAMGAGFHRGGLEDAESLRAGVVRSDAVIHTAFNHDFSRYIESCVEDRRAIEVMGAALEGSGRPMLVTATLGFLAPGRIATEADSPSPSSPRASEAAAAALAARGLRVSSVRLPPSTHDLGDRVGFVPQLAAIARAKGVSAYIGEGLNRWPAVHRLDAARLYRLAIERGAEGGPFHAVGDEGVPLRTIAEIIGRQLGLPVASVAPEAAAGHFGWMAPFAALDAPSSAKRTEAVLGWRAEEPGLRADIDRPAYFTG